jgi:mannose-6-phosphate isomerase
MRPEPTRIEPIFSPRIWGAKSLAPLFPEKINLTEPLGEAWLTGVDCKIATGPYAGKTLGTAWHEMPAEWRGSRLASTPDFPLLVKFIFPTDKLSIQVHPDDAYASVHEKAAGGRGKTEMWYVVSAKQGARLLAGLRAGVTKESFLEALAGHTLEEIFQSYEVRAGDTFYIPAGTPHTIGPNMVICEVQEYSDLTYRIYDYDRVDAHGKPRELHIDKAIHVMDFQSKQNLKAKRLGLEREGLDLAIDDDGGSLLAACKYFAAAKWDISRAQKRYSADGDPAFSLFVFLSGDGQLVWREGSSTYAAGQCWFLPAEFEEISVVPSRPTSILEAYVPDVRLLLKELKHEGFADDSLSQTVFL